MSVIEVTTGRPVLEIQETPPVEISAQRSALTLEAAVTIAATVIATYAQGPGIVVTTPAPVRTVTIGKVAGFGEDPMSVLAKEIDDQTAADGTGYIYRGYAGAGVDTDAATWRIERLEITEDAGGRQDITTRFAQKDGVENSGFVHVWDDRASLNYGP